MEAGIKNCLTLNSDPAAAKDLGRAKKMQAAMVISGRLEAAKCVGIGFVGLDVCSSQVVVGDAYVGHRAVILLVIGSIGVDDQ